MLFLRGKMKPIEKRTDQLANVSKKKKKKILLKMNKIS